jgi:hypothetical protein
MTLALAFALVAAACVAPDATSGDEADAVDLERARGSFQVMDDRMIVLPPEGAAEPQAAARLLYMNKDGGAYTPGSNDARTNRSTLIQVTRQIPAWEVDAGTWADVMSCVREQFAPWDIDVTDVDPGNVAHFESVVGGGPGDLGMPNGVAGVSPFTSDCRLIPNSIVFTFTDALPDNARVVCEVVAQEVSHSFGLDHEFLCEDPMTYLSGCGAKTFQDVAAPCGEFEQRASCAIAGKYDCGRDTQNSVELLTQRLGLRPGTPPMVSITAPADGAVVPPGFTVSVDATDDVGVTAVELRIDGESIATASAAPYDFTAPADLAEGAHVVEVIAGDGTGETSTSVSVEVSADAPPEGDDPPGDDDDDGGGGDDGGDGEAGGDADGDGVPDANESSLVGGCAVGRGKGSAWLVLAIGFLLLRRRRR